MPFWCCDVISLLAERAIVYGLLAALCFGAGWKVNGWRLGEGIAQEKAEAVIVVRYIEREQQQIADTEGKVGHDQIEQARRDADAARATAVGLRAEAGRIATRLATCNAGTSAERQARSEAGRVFADVLADVEQQGRRMAEIADRARFSGMTCERVYDGVRQSSRN
ncbi:i-spanin [Pseudomonas phage vB_PcuM_ KLEP17-4]|nr:i-spanin [Pseudomonas phage vB_PcuM_ KLEP17-4]